MSASVDSKPDPVLPLLVGHLLGICPDAIEIGLDGPGAERILRMPAVGQHDKWIQAGSSANKVFYQQWTDFAGRKFPTLDIPLHIPSVGTVGRVHVLFDNNKPLDKKSVLEAFKPVLICLAGHLRIAEELKQVNAADQRQDADIDLIGELDEALSEDPSSETVIQALQPLGERLTASEIFVVLRGHPERYHWHDGPMDPDAKSRSARSLAKILAGVMASRRVTVTPESKNGLTSQVVACPVLDSRGDVHGALIARSPGLFDRWSVRLLRSAAPKFRRLKQARPSTFRPLKRSVFMSRVDGELEKDREQPRALLCIDIDRLHVINERFGHKAGDAALERVIEAVTDCAGPQRLLGRMSGDLLALYLRGCDDAGYRKLEAEIRTAVRAIQLDGKASNAEIDVSIGAVLMPQHARNAAQAINNAELALRSAKSRGGRRAVLFGEEDASIMQRHTDLTAIGRLQGALIAGDFRLFAQEIRTLHGDGTRKYEILTRMVDEDGNLLAPAKFLSAAERYNMMPAFDRWVVDRALNELSGADSMLEIGMSMFSINLAGQSISDPAFVDFVIEAVLASGLPPDAICFEITESTAVRAIDAATEFIQRIRRTGCRVALDDFGAGYCSFGYLQELDVDFIKIDGQFIRNLQTDPLSGAIVQAIVTIAGVRGAQTIAEFAENMVILQKLTELGVDYGQGFAIAKPVPLKDILATMETPLKLGLTDAFKA